MALTKITPQMFDTSAAGHDFNIDNGTFVVDASANRVGIGTPTPSTLLDVNGALTATTIAGTTSVTTADFRYSGGAGYLTYSLNQAATDTLNIRRYGTVQQQFTQYGVNFPSGNIGIGATNPNTNLQLYHATDDISINVNHGTGGSYPKKSGISFGATSTSLGGDATFTGGAGIQVTNTAASNNPTEMGFFTTSGGAPTTRMLIDSDGNVGIGLSSLTEKLEVSGSINATNQSANFAVGAQRGFLDMVSASKHVRIGSLTGAATATGTQGTVEIIVNNSPKVVVDENGNVGIGTPAFTPDALLHLKTNVNNTARLKLESTASNSYPYLTFKNDAREYGIYGAHGGLSDAFSIYDNTAGAHRLTIDSSGNVGIGTTDPEGRLMVEVTGANATPPIKINRGLDGGRIQLQYSGNETGYGEIGQMYAGTGRTQIWIGANLNSFSTGHNSSPAQHDANYASWFSDWDSYRDRFTISRIASGTTSSLLLIDSNGNVGIGTNSPDRALEVSTDGTAQFRLSRVDTTINGNNTIGSIEFMGTDDTSGTVGATIVAHAATTWGGGSYPTDLRFSTMTGSTLSERMRIDSGGIIRIGPDAQDIQIYPASVSGSNNLIYMRGNASGDKSEIQMNHYGYADFHIGVGHVANGVFNIGNNKTDNDFVINGSGNVGIGTTNPGYKLTVVGESSIGDFSANGFANLGRNADGNQDVTTLGGYGIDAGSGTRYGRYGVLRFRSSANYTSGSRGYMITNGYGANKFAILQSSSATTMPSLGSYGGVSGGTAPFIMDSSGDITMGYQPAAYGRITGNITSPGQDYGIALTTDYYRNITAQTNSTHGPGLTITRAGVYIMSMSFLYDPVGTYVYIGWCVNGTIIHHFHSNHAISNNHDGHSSIARYLNVGDHLTIERTTANAITTIYGNTHSYWWVCKVG